MNKHFHNLVLGVSVLPALLVMPAAAEYKYKMPEVTPFATLPSITTTITDNVTGYNLFTGTGIRNIVSGDVNLSVLGTKDSPVVILQDGSSWDFQKPTGIIGNLYFPKNQASNWDNTQEVEYASSSYVAGNLNIELDHVNMAGKLYGSYDYLDTAFYNSALETQPDLITGVKGTTTITVNNSTIGGTIYAAAVPNAGAEPSDKQVYANYLKDHVLLGDVVVNINNSEVGEVTPVGAYLTAKNVEINLRGNSEITDTSGDGIVAGISRTAGRVSGNTLVNIDTAGKDNTITVAGYGINSGSRKKDADNDSVQGTATLNMLGGGTITAANIVSYKVKGISTLNLTGGTHANATTLVEGFNEINIDDKSVLNAEKLVMTSADALNITLTDSDNYGKLIVNTLDANGAKLNMTVHSAGTYDVVTAGTVVENSDFSWNLANPIYKLEQENGTVTASVKDTEAIANDANIAKDSAQTIAHVAKSDSAQLQDLSVKIQEKLVENTPEAKAAVEHATKAINPETESVAQSVSTSVQNTLVSLASARMSSPSVGRSGGDVEFTSGGVWAQGLFNKSKQNDAFNGYTRGIAVGMDGTINKDWTIGAGYSYAHSDINGTARNTEIDSNTIFVYGQYKPTEWYLNAIANYTMSDYSERGTILDGITVIGDYDVDSFGGALATGYDFANGVTPELGLRYMHVNANDYANSYGIKTHMDDTDFLTGVIGAKYAFNVAATKHLTFMPQLNAGVKYDLLSDKNIATVTMPGLNAYTLDGNRLKRIGGEFGIGLGMQYRELNVSVNYDIDVREDYTSQTGMLKFRYDF